MSNLAEGVKFVILVLLLTFALFYVGCVDLDGVDLPVSGSGTGLVKRVDVEHKQITISHDRVEPVIDALTMSYVVQDLSMLDSIRDNDSVRFTIREDVPGNFVLTNLDKL